MLGSDCLGLAANEYLLDSGLYVPGAALAEMTGTIQFPGPFDTSVDETDAPDDTVRCQALCSLEPTEHHGLVALREGLDLFGAHHGNVHRRFENAC